MKVTNKLFYFMLFFIISCTTTEVSLDNTYKLDHPFSAFGLGFEINYPATWTIRESPYIKHKDNDTLIKNIFNSQNYHANLLSIYAPDEEAEVIIFAEGGGRAHALAIINQVERTQIIPIKILEKKELLISGNNAVYLHARFDIEEAKRRREANLKSDNEALRKWAEEFYPQMPISEDAQEQIFIGIIRDSGPIIIKYTASNSSLFEKHNQEGLAIINSIKLNE